MSSQVDHRSVRVTGFSIAVCELGYLGVVSTMRGICFLGFDDDAQVLEQTLYDENPGLATARGDEVLPCIALLQSLIAGHALNEPLALDLQGTAFQLRVWNLLTKIPRGETRTYHELAIELGDKKLTRAVARACATNPVSLLVPCHRVVRSDGGLAGYRWGVDRKRQLLDWERKSSRSKEGQVNGST